VLALVLKTKTKFFKKFTAKMLENLCPLNNLGTGFSQEAAFFRALKDEY